MFIGKRFPECLKSWMENVLKRDFCRLTTCDKDEESLPVDHAILSETALTEGTPYLGLHFPVLIEQSAILLVGGEKNHPLGFHPSQLGEECQGR